MGDSVQWIALVACTGAIAACSYPTLSRLSSDPQSDEPIVPELLEIDDVAPATIYEGQGDFGSQPALVVIHGKNFIDSNTLVEIVPSAAEAAQLSLGTPVIANNGHWIALPVTAHVDENLTKGDSIALDVRVTQTIPLELGGGMATAIFPGQLTLVGLKELKDTTTPEVTGNNIDTTRLEEFYSKVDLSGITSAQLVGANRAIIHSMSSISVATLIAKGADGGGGSGGAARVGGCAGGSASSRGGCDTRIGGEGGLTNPTLGSAGGGGGGGFATAGISGTGVSAGGGGSSTGDELIVTYDGFGSSSLNRSGGGGGGGNSELGSPGGGGGGGGGSIELTAGGDLLVASIAADGGPGGNSSGGGGGGGGGAGGLVMLRAGGSLTTMSAISVRGGAGGSGGGGSGGLGGLGSDGRVRWDAQVGGPPTVPKGTVHRGPSFALDTQVFRTSTPSIKVVGTANDRFDVSWTNSDMTYAGLSYIIGTVGTMVIPMLPQGLNHFCITLAGGKVGSSEATKCIDVAFLP
jgi:hypothetical protein